jgi:Fe-S oxidoreductase
MSTNTLILLLATLAAFTLFGARVWKRFGHLRFGRRSPPFRNWWQRIMGVVVYVAGQQRLFRFPLAGTAHFFIFWGFMLLFPTILQAIVEGFVPGFTFPVLGSWGPFLLLQDVIASLVALAVLYGLWMRAVVRPERYKGSHQAEGNLVLCFILTIMLSLLCMNGIRITLGEVPVALAGWQPISHLAGGLFAGMREAARHLLYGIFYWLHLGVVLVFLTLLPTGKHFHVVTSIFGVLLRNLAPVGRLPRPAEDTTEGVGRIEQFTRRQMFDWFSCTECGRCQEVCPAYASGLPLSPKLLVMGLRAHLFERGEALARSGNGHGPAADNVLARDLTGEVITDEVIWACTTCLACDRECPLFIEHVTPLVEMRRHVLAKQRADAQLMTALTNLRRYGNSFGKSDRQRAMWTREAGITVRDARKEKVHTLWYVGDYASYSPTLTAVTQATARLFDRVGLDWGILYDGERNAGNDVRRIGEEGLFEMLAAKNVLALAKAQFEEIVTTDPHTYNTLRNEYAELDPEFQRPVRHHSEVLAEALASGRLPVTRRLEVGVTFHDPCYLGRYNGIYEAPRDVLKAIGCRLIEMPNNRSRSVCCGAGGGRIWMEEEGVKERPAERRIREALELEGVEVFAVACPKDVTMYRDAVKTVGAEGRIEVKELVELVVEATGV